MSKYLDETGLEHLWGKIKDYADDAADAVLPTVSSADNGKVLMVVSGAWEAATLPVYNGGVS